MPGRKSRTPVRECHEGFGEDDRFSKGLGRLEFERTKSIVGKYLPPAPAVVLDVGGGTGLYSLWLARHGYQAHLIEISPRLIGRALNASRGQSDAPLAGFTIGDARCLGFANRSADAVLMLGPLYHLTEKEERLRALGEAYRTLRHNGVLFAAAMSRFASFLDGMMTESVRDTTYDAHLHLPSELREEVEETGFSFVRMLPVEGVGALVADLEVVWEDERLRIRLLETVAAAEDEETALGVSPHIICVARKNH
jgi:ubiquinone/menaquinone biosynthesis C-methylase UbiE